MKGQYMFSCVILLGSAFLTFAEPPVPGSKSVVSQRLLNRVADIIANGGDGSNQNEVQTNEGASIVDKELLDRIARIVSQNDGQLSWASKHHHKNEEQTASSQPSRSLSLPKGNNGEEQQYGVPPSEVPPSVKELIGTQYELSPPEPVPRIASFDITGDDDDNYSSGYSSAPQGSQDTYADNRNLYQSGNNGRNGKLDLGQPESAVRIASFDIEGEKPPAPYTPPQARAGYYNN